MHHIDIPRDFSPTPGARYISDGPHSGQEFRHVHLEPLFADPNDSSEIVIHLDGAAGYATSFLEEAFGGLARLFGKKRCLDRLRIISDEDPLLIKEVDGYIQDVAQ